MAGIIPVRGGECKRFRPTPAKASGPEPEIEGRGAFRLHLTSQRSRVPATDVLTSRDGKGPTMEDQRFDALAKTVGDGAGSRRRALQMVGAALASAGLLSHFSPEAAAGPAQKRCKHKGGIYLAKGACHCARTCKTPPFTNPMPCNGNPNCQCLQTPIGTGFCGTYVAGLTAEPSDCICDGCLPGAMCAVVPRCAELTDCMTTKECLTSFGTGHACINGRCEFTSCVVPCPTQP